MIANVTGSLCPVGFPASELLCTATAVYVPKARDGVAGLDCHAAPDPAAVALDTSVPFDDSPA